MKDLHETFSAVLAAELDQVDESGKTARERIAAAVVSRALDGDLRAVALVAACPEREAAVSILAERQNFRKMFPA